MTTQFIRTALIVAAAAAALSVAACSKPATDASSASKVDLAMDLTAASDVASKPLLPDNSPFQALSNMERDRLAVPFFFVCVP